VELAESGAYIAGDRRVSRTERTKWRVTFRRLATDLLMLTGGKQQKSALSFEELRDIASRVNRYGAVINELGRLSAVGEKADDQNYWR